MYCLVFSTIMIKRSYSWYLILLNYSILLIRHDNYDICINNTLNNYEQGKCRLRLKLFCNFILSERINKVYIYNITASMFSVSLYFCIYLFYIFYINSTFMWYIGYLYIQLSPLLTSVWDKAHFSVYFVHLHRRNTILTMHIKTVTNKI